MLLPACDSRFTGNAAQGTQTELSVMPFVKTEGFELCRIKTEREARCYCFVVKDAAAMLNAICHFYLRDPNYQPRKAEQDDDFKLLASNFPYSDPAILLYEGIILQTNAHNKSTCADFISRDLSLINCCGVHCVQNTGKHLFIIQKK